MLIKGDVPMLCSWTSAGKRDGDPNQSLIIGHAGFGVIPGQQTDGKIVRAAGTEIPTYAEVYNCRRRRRSGRVSKMWPTASTRNT